MEALFVNSLFILIEGMEANNWEVPAVIDSSTAQDLAGKAQSPVTLAAPSSAVALVATILSYYGRSHCLTTASNLSRIPPPVVSASTSKAVQCSHIFPSDQDKKVYPFLRMR